jgi:hypothetical protein
MEPGESSYAKQRSQFPVAFLAGLIIVAILVGGIVLVVLHTRNDSTGAARKLPFGPSEQAYAERVHFRDIRLAHATNFLNQDFTYVGGTISNDGVRDIRALEVEIEFRDALNQVILRETQELVVPGTDPIAAGQRRDFQVTLEHLSSEWNQQYPSIQVTGLLLQ